MGGTLAKCKDFAPRPNRDVSPLRRLRGYIGALRGEAENETLT